MRAPQTAVAREPGKGETSEPHTRGFHHDFSNVQHFAAQFDDPSRGRWQRPSEVVELMRLSKKDEVVDLGAGTGYFLEPLSRAVGPEGRVIALDVEPRMVEHLSRRARDLGLANVTARVVGANDPGLEQATTDRVLIVNTWHHLDARSRYAHRLARSLAPGGEIWVVDFTLESELGPPREHRLSAEQVASEFVAGGLWAEVVEETLPLQYAVRATLPPTPVPSTDRAPR